MVSPVVEARVRHLFGTLRGIPHSRQHLRFSEISREGSGGHHPGTGPAQGVRPVQAPGRHGLHGPEVREETPRTASRGRPFPWHIPLSATGRKASPPISTATPNGSSSRPPGTFPRAKRPGCVPRAFFSAYLKIAEGCGNRCTFCLIPRLRGPYRSRTTADVADEARRFAAEGVKEINLIAQDTTAFGSDRGERNGLVRLLETPGGYRRDRVDPDALRVS